MHSTSAIALWLLMFILYSINNLWANQPSAMQTGIQQYQSQDFALAVDSFLEQLAEHPEDGTTYYNLALAYHAAGNDSMALPAIINALKYLPPHEKLFFLRGEILMTLGEYGLAIPDFNRALELNFLSYRAFQNRGWCYLQQNEPDKAMDDLNRAIALYSGSAPAHYYRAMTHCALGDTVAAFDDLHTALKIEPESPQANLAKANLLFEQTKYAEALAHYNSYLETNKLDHIAFNNRGLTRSFLKDHRGAVDDFTQAIILNPKSKYYFNRGAEYFVLGKKQDAIEDLKLAIDDENPTFDMYLLRGKLYSDATEYELAIADLDKAHAMKPDSRRITDMLFKVRLNWFFTRYWLYLLAIALLLLNGIRLFRRYKANNA